MPTKKEKSKTGKNGNTATDETVYSEHYKKEEFDKFVAWLALPHIFRKRDEKVVAALGLEDEQTIELLSINTQKEFGERYGVSKNLMKTWKDEIRAKGHLYQQQREWVKSVMSNVLGAVYKKALIEGDANRAKFLATFTGQYVEKSENSNPASDLVNTKIVEFLDRFKNKK